MKTEPYIVMFRSDKLECAGMMTVHAQSENDARTVFYDKLREPDLFVIVSVTPQRYA